jgi:AcrR family transcriptional regulator
MDSLFKNIKIIINNNLYLIDPETSKLGKKIIIHAIDLIEELGFEKFNFKKLGDIIDSPEASIYRYFKNKNQLLLYLISWYWGWMEYILVFETNNIVSPETRLKKSIAMMSPNSNENIIIEGIEINKLHRIVVSESIKAFLTKEVNKSNTEGAYMNYKQFVARIAEIITEMNPEYKYPQMLLTTIIEGMHLQAFFAIHLPRLTNKQDNENYITDFYTDLAFQSINKKS